MTELSADPSALKRELDDLGIDLADGGTAGVGHVERRLNLNAMAIGLGLETVVYEPETFPGLVYQPEDKVGTITLFEDGSVAVIGAADRADARAAITETLSELRELGLLDGELSDDGIRFTDDAAEPTERPLLDIVQAAADRANERIEPANEELHTELLSSIIDDEPVPRETVDSGELTETFPPHKIRYSHTTLEKLGLLVETEEGLRPSERLREER